MSRKGAELRLWDGEGGTSCWAAGGCRSAEHGSGVACQAASASLPLGSVRPITNLQSLFQHKQDLQRVGSLSVLVFFLHALLKKMKAERPILKSQVDNCF